MRASSSPCCSLILILLVVLLRISGYQVWSHDDAGAGQVVKRDDRKEIVSTEYGTISSVDGIGLAANKYQLQLISLDPNSLFLPAILHAHMVFYVHTGSGRLSYSSPGQGQGGEMNEIRLRRGDVFSLQSGTIFFMQSDLDESQRQRFRINAIFSNADDIEEQGKLIEAGPYSFIHHLFQGFDKTLLQAAFQVSEEIVEEIKNGSCRTPPIVHATGSKDDKRGLTQTKIVDGIKRFGMDLRDELLNKKKKPSKEDKSAKTFNLFKEDPDVKNCNGWSTAVTSKHLPALKASNIGVFMVNLTTNAMMGPHWNPTATEIGVVLEGRGMVRVVCSSNLTRPECNNTRFLVEEGDIFVVPRFHPMAHMSFNNETLVFMGFTTSDTNNHPQFLAGEASVLRALNQRMLQVALNVNSTTITKLLGARKGSTILDCVSCAEEEQQIEKREEKVRKQQEEQQRRQEKEEEERRRQEEEDERRRQEEDEKRRQEEKQRQQEEEEEGRKRQQEKEKRRRREEEEERRQKQERREQQEEQRQEEKEREQEAERRQEEEEKRQREEEGTRQEEEEEKEEQQEEEERRQRGEQEERKRQQEETARREKEERERSRQHHHKGGGGEETEEEAATREEEERGAQWEEHPHPSYMPIS